MIKSYFKSAFPVIAVFPAQAGNQPHYEVQSSSNAQLYTRLREYDGKKTAVFPIIIAAISKITVFPAQAGNQSYYEVQSSSNAQLDTRVREYDGAKAQNKTNKK